MKYKKYSNYSYNLHIIKTNKFKTVTVEINFKSKLNKKDITYRNLLINVLCNSTSVYPKKRLMEIATEELYNLNYRVSNYISGKYNIMSFDVTFLNEKYTEEGMLDKSVNFLSDIIFKPNVIKQKNSIIFDESSYKNSYNLLKASILSQKENPDNYSKIRLLEEIEPNSNLSYRGVGYLEDLEDITPKKLYKYYEKVINSDIIDIFVIGDVNESQVKKIIEESFHNIKTLKKPAESHFLESKKARFFPKKVKEKQKVAQSKLYLGYRIDKMTDFELRYVLNVYSYILGGGPDSKLFKKVREENSLCYYISSSGQPLTSLLLISAGIKQEDYRKALNLIKKEVSNMKSGKFNDEDIIKAKVTYVNGLKELEDNPISILNLYAGIEYLGSDDITKRLLNINKVTKSDVVKLASKIHLDTVYLLEGDQDEEK